MESGRDSYYNTPGCVWVASPDPLQSKASRPVAIGRRINSRYAVVIPGTSVCHKGQCPVKVRAKECEFLHVDTYFLPRLYKYVSLDNLSRYLGELPGADRKRLDEKISIILLKKRGIPID